MIGSRTLQVAEASGQLRGACSFRLCRCRDVTKAGARASDLFKLCLSSPALLLDEAHNSGLG